MSLKDNIKVSAEDLKEITAIGVKAVKRVSEAIENKTTEALSFDAEKILSNDIRATVGSIKAEMLAYRIVHDKLG